MKILWITNTIFPDVCLALNRPVSTAGGWMFHLAKIFSEVPDISLTVATVWSGKDLREMEINGIAYYLLPSDQNATKYNPHLEELWKSVVDNVMPDLCHIHGTEYPHGLACMNACLDLKYVISIQGLISVYSDYYYAGIRPIEILKHITCRDILRMDTIFQQKKKFKLRGKLEIEYIKKSKNIIGRTNWDRAHVKAINPHIEYYFCNEVLRSSFYAAPKWELEQKVNHSIFLSQAWYPIKGLHQVLKAVALIKQRYGTIKLRIAGQDITKSKTISDKVRLSGYGAYLKALINNLNLSGQVTFIGQLTEEQMVEEYIKAHVFICPSSIENSPNSLGEAQIIGIPCVASFVGGVPDMVKDGETGLLYRFDDFVMLAHQVQRIFSNDKFAIALSEASCFEAQKRHDRVKNTTQLLKIYSNLAL